MLLLALLSFNISKLQSARRLLHLFSAIQVPIAPVENIKLYYVGMFYNLFLPGGIGGDAYKVYYLHKRYGNTVKQLLAAVLLDRIAGAAILVCLALAFALFTDDLFSQLPEMAWWAALAGALCAIPALVLLIRKVFPGFRIVTGTTVTISFQVQMMQVVCALAILWSMGIQSHLLLYFSLFLVSSLAAMLPVSIGGVGLRELMFVYASMYLPIDEAASVALGLLFFLITCVSSLAGVVIKLPENKVIASADSADV